MIDTPYFRHKENKCPICGTMERSNEDEKICQVCSTRFNNFMILEIGREKNFMNN